MINKEAATAVAQWWRKQLEHPTKDMGTEEHGGNSMATMLGLLLAHESTVSENQLDNFEEALVRIIVEEGETNLSCDYGPDHYLNMAAKEAGVDTNRFPWKSWTCIRSNGDVEARLGYEGTPTIIYDADIAARKAEVEKLKKICNHRKSNGQVALKINENAKNGELYFCPICGAKFQTIEVDQW